MSAAPTPITEVSASDARALRGVVFDVDDTLTRDGVLEPEAYAALFRLRAAGLARVAVTGRPLGWSDVFAATWPLDCAIGENGAGWAWREGRSLRSAYFDDEAARATQRAMLERVRARVAAAFPELRESADSIVRRCDLAYDIGESVRVEPARVRALEALIRAEGARVSTSSVHCHAVPGAWDKARGASRAIREVLAHDGDCVKRQWLFVGDSGNDVEAFAFFDKSAGPSNVLDHTMSAGPRWVSSADRGLGFAEIVDVLLARRAA